jgi:DNA-binding SARP family transcriptional activator
MGSGTGTGARMHLLGEFRLDLGGQPYALPGTARRLLAFLAVVHRGRRTGRAELAESMRPDADPGRATSTLRSVLWRLPRPQGHPLVGGSATEVWLHPDVSVDLWDGERQASELCRTAPPSAEWFHDLTLLGADLLPGWHDPWLTVEQESYRQRRLHALERVADLLCASGRFADALLAALGAVRSEPLRESAHRRVIEVHLAEDNHAEALRQYHHYRRLLAQELGLPPSDSIRQLVAPLLGRPVDVRPRRRA